MCDVRSEIQAKHFVRFDDADSERREVESDISHSLSRNTRLPLCRWENRHLVTGSAQCLGMHSIAQYDSGSLHGCLQ